jgi:two-component system nitrate/nitrite response regulator NarL
VLVPRILLCDDDANYRALLRLVLTESGEHEIVGEAADGIEAVERASETRPDVVLLDLNMPRAGGHEAIPRIREVSADSRVVALTTARREEQEAEVIALGGDAFIEKPTDVMDLPEVLRSTLREAARTEAELAEKLLEVWGSGNVEEILRLFHADVTYTPLGSRTVVRGLDGVRAFDARTRARGERRRLERLRMLLSGSTLALLGVVSEPAGRRGTESYPIAWVLELRRGKVAAVVTYGDTGEALRAAGIAPDTPPVAERESQRGSGLSWLRERWPVPGRPAFVTHS